MPNIKKSFYKEALFTLYVEINSTILLLTRSTSAIAETRTRKFGVIMIIEPKEYWILRARVFLCLTSIIWSKGMICSLFPKPMITKLFSVA